MHFRINLNKVMQDLKLIYEVPEQSKKLNRPGFIIPTIAKKDPVPLFCVPERAPVLVYEAGKLTHNGVTGYKVFENCHRRFHNNSIANLLSSTVHGNETLDWLIAQYLACSEISERETINSQATKLLDQSSFDKYLTLTRQNRHLNASQSRKIRNMADKLAFYTADRKFKSKKTGSYNFKVAFLTLTAPECAENEQILKAFDVMLDYLSRTANCYYVWKKELGETGKKLHFHLIINNFIPYYIISWKWKRALLSQGVNWPQNLNAKDSNSHYRIELPRNKRQTSHYISKYLSKAYDMPSSFGYLAGWSRVLNSLKEITVSTGEPAFEELRQLLKNSKVIRKDFVTIVLTNLLEVKAQFPLLGSLFESQYLSWCSKITLPQKFHSI